MSKTLKLLCEDIEKCYDDGLTMFDSPLAEKIEELSSNKTDEIKELIEIVELAVTWYNTGIGKAEAGHNLEMAIMRHLKGST